MKSQTIRDSFGWGFLLWLFGYILGFLFFAIVPQKFLGWAIMPFGITVSVWVLRKKIRTGTFRYFLLLGLIWTVLAVVLDYLFIVRLLKPADGYYKPDVYIYYALTFLLPLIAGKRSSGR